MELKGEHRIPAPRDAVWEALNDPEVLRASIPGCETLEKTDDNAFEATVQAKVGPVKARFAGAVTLSNINAPESYTISGEGKGGAAGFAKGGADVSLAEDGGETVLTYKVDAKVGGKLAQIGSRLIDSTAKKMANEFFENFVAQVNARHGAGGDGAAEPGDAAVSAGATPEPGAAPAKAEDGTPETRSGLPPALWIGGVVAAVIVLIILFA